jgi:hypothetical protein
VLLSGKNSKDFLARYMTTTPSSVVLKKSLNRGFQGALPSENCTISLAPLLSGPWLYLAPCCAVQFEVCAQPFLLSTELCLERKLGWCFKILWEDFIDC